MNGDFTGNGRDAESGLDYFGARYYWSDGALWLSVDPLADKYPATSPYIFCLANPVKYIDYNGLDTIPVDMWGRFGKRIPGDPNEIVFVTATRKEVRRGRLYDRTIQREMYKLPSSALITLQRKKRYKESGRISSIKLNLEHVDDPAGFYNFLEKNTIVEFGYVPFVNKNTLEVNAYLFTSHKIGEVGLPDEVWNVIETPGSYFLISLIHSHDCFPGYECDQPSPDDLRIYNYILRYHRDALFYIYYRRGEKLDVIDHETIMKKLKE